MKYFMMPPWMASLCLRPRKMNPFMGDWRLRNFVGPPQRQAVPYLIHNPFSFFSFEVIEVQHPPVRVNLVLNCLFQSFKRSSPQIRTT